MGSFYMEATQINYRRDETFKTVDQKLQELSETSAIDTDIAPVFKSTNTYAPGDMVYYRNKLYVFNVEHTGAWAAGDVTATDVTTEISSLKSGLTNYQTQNDLNLEVPNRKNLIDSSAFSNGYFTSEGILTENQYYYATDYIKVEPNTDYVVSGFTGGGAYFVYYNASKTVLSTIVDTTTTFKTPANTAFMRLSIKRDGMTNPQMELGTTATSYTPYIPSVESRIEAVEKCLVSYDMSNWNDYPDFVGKYAVVGKVLFFSLKVTKADSSWNLAGIANRQVLINGACVAYDNANNAQIIATNTSGSIVLQIQDTDTFTNPTNVSGCFMLA